MSNRIVHLIHSECDIYIQRISSDTVRVRVTEKDPDLSNPTDFEIEGDAACISEALTSIAAVLTNLEACLAKEPN